MTKELIITENLTSKICQELMLGTPLVRLTKDKSMPSLTRVYKQIMKDKGFVEGEDYRQVAFIHDEIQVLVKKGIEDEVGKIAVESISMAGNLLNLKVPLTGEYNFGSNCAETH